jgi:hypothetical protein
MGQFTRSAVRSGSTFGSPPPGRRPLKPGQPNTSGKKWTTTNRRATKTSTTFCVFSLDRIFADVDTANPDSGDVDAPGGPSRGRYLGPV